MSKSKRYKSNLLPSLYSQLTEEEQADVKNSMISYNTMYADKPFYEPSQFYQMIYKRTSAIQFTQGVKT